MKHVDDRQATRGVAAARSADLDVQGQVGSMLRIARRRRGWTLREAAAASGERFKTSTIAAYELGRRSITVSALYELAELYDTSVTALLAPRLGANDRTSTLMERIDQLPVENRELIISLVDQMYRDTRLPAELVNRQSA
jgi:transcriptional regulator with XRE-family HTH domain